MAALDAEQQLVHPLVAPPQRNDHRPEPPGREDFPVSEVPERQAGAKLTGRGGSDKMAVAGVKDRHTLKVRAAVVERVDGPTLKGFVADVAAPGVTVYTDEATAYAGLENREAVQHGIGEYIRGAAGINGMESFWSMLKRGYVGVFHRMSPEHLHRYVAEFEGRHNNRDRSTADQMAAMVRGAEGRLLRYRDLTNHHHGRQATAV